MTDLELPGSLSSLEILLTDGVNKVALSDLEDENLRTIVETLAEEADCAATLIPYLKEKRQNAVEAMEPLSPPPEIRGKKLEKYLYEINVLAGGKTKVPTTGGHLLDQLSRMPAYATAAPILSCSDVSILWCLIRSGRIAERKSAVRRLGRLIIEKNTEKVEFDERDLVEGLTAIRDPRIAYEVDSALAAIPGSAGRTARQRRSRVDKLLNQVHNNAKRFWAGEMETDPFETLSREESLRLGVYLRRSSDDLVSHLAEYMRRLLGKGDRSQLSDTIGAIIPSGDERLVPTLCRILADGPLSARITTARALGRMSDPRVHPALVKAYRHASDITEKTVLGGALGQYGDQRALDFLLEQLDGTESLIWEEAIRSLGSVGNEKAASKLVEVLKSDRSSFVRATARALIRCGSPTEMKQLRVQARDRPQYSTALNDSADALALRLQLLGRIELGGEGATKLPLAKRSQDQITSRTSVTPEPSVSQKIQSTFYYLLGVFWSLLWQRSRALASYETAARIHPRAAYPHLREADIHAANNRDDLAIESYRRALLANKKWLIRRPIWVQRLLRVFLRRADSLVARRRKKDALRLLDEVAGLDLRMADLDLRLAMTRRRDRLLVDHARRKLVEK